MTGEFRGICRYKFRGDKKMTMKEAMKDYNDGNWNSSINKLQAVKMEADVYISWNLWKMQRKDEAASIWKEVISGAIADNVTKASAHAGLGIYYAEKGDREEALKHAQLARDFLPEDVTSQQNKNLNACGIAIAKNGELKKAEEILKKVAQINKQLMESGNIEIAKEAMHQYGKNNYNLATLVHIPQENWNAADNELTEAIIFYRRVGAETDEAAAHHRKSEIYEKNNHLCAALVCEKRSLKLWKKHPDDPKRIETAQENIKRIENKMREQK